MDFVNQNIMCMNRKLDKVHVLFADTLRYSSKTYFNEAINQEKMKINVLESKV